MKNINFVKILLITISSINVAYALKLSVDVPFNNVPMFAEKYSGLDIGYNLSTLQPRMVVCTMVNKNAAYLEYRYGGGSSRGRKRVSVVDKTFILSSEGEEKPGYVWVVKAGSSALLYDDYQKDFDVLVSCHYAPDGVYKFIN